MNLCCMIGVADGVASAAPSEHDSSHDDIVFRKDAVPALPPIEDLLSCTNTAAVACLPVTASSTGKVLSVKSYWPLYVPFML